MIKWMNLEDKRLCLESEISESIISEETLIQVMKICVYTYGMWAEMVLRSLKWDSETTDWIILVNWWYIWTLKASRLNTGHVRDEIPELVSSNGMILKWVMVYEKEGSDGRFGISILRHLWIYKWTHCSWESSISDVVIQECIRQERLGYAAETHDI